jgi:hypothetical protein
MKTNSAIDQIKKEYPYIYLWGKMIQSNEYYIVVQARQAREDFAPKNATYKGDWGWHTTDTCNPLTLKRLNDLKNILL